MIDHGSDSGDGIVIEKRTGYLLVTLPEIVAMHDCSRIESSILRACPGKGDRIAFDVSRLRAVYSTVLGILIRIRKNRVEHGGVVSIINASRSLLKILHSLNLDRLFPIYATEVEFEISQDDVWRRRLTERKEEFLFVARVEKGTYRIVIAGDMVAGYDLSVCGEFKPVATVKNYLIDLSGLASIDATGAGVFIALLGKIEAGAGVCRVYGANKAVRQVMKFLGAERHAKFYKKEEAALAGENA
jgi:anti-anti-sigma regulatory factor